MRRGGTPKVETGNNKAKLLMEVEVAAKGWRRRFRAEYKLKALREGVIASGQERLGRC
jgi:hypothetical protein